MKKKIIVFIFLFFLVNNSYSILDEKIVVSTFESVKKSIVFIEIFARIPSETEEIQQTFEKNGLIIDKSGYILTSFISDEIVTDIKVIIDEKEYSAKLIGNDKVAKISVIKIQPEQNLIPAKFSNKILQKGEMLIGIYCLDETQNYEKLFYTCMISGILPSGLFDEFYLGVVHSIDGVVLCNASGEIQSMMIAYFGIPFSLFEKKQIKTNNEVEMMRAPVKAVSILPIIQATKRILENEKSTKISWVGVQIEKLSKQQAEGFGISHNGVLVTRVFKNSPAERGGLEVSDVIIESNSRKITKNESGLKLLVDIFKSHPTDTEMQLKIIRDRHEKNLKIIPIEFPEPEQFRNELLGLTVQEINDMVYNGLNLFSDKGVVVSDVELASAGDNAKIKAGDLIVGLGDWEIQNIDQWQNRLDEIFSNKVKNVLLRIYRGNKTLIRVVKIEK